METIEQILKKIEDQHNPSFDLSIQDCHVKGLFSLVVDGVDPGNLTRVFMAGQEIKPFDVQIHNHRYDIRITAISGNIHHHMAVKKEDGMISTTEYAYQSVLNGGKGLTKLGETRMNCYDYKLPIGATVDLRSDEFHTMSCSKNAMWVVQECGYRTEESRVLGVPFGFDGLYVKPTQSQINQKREELIAVLKKLVNAYGLAG